MGHWILLVVAISASVLCAACDATLPDPDSPGARLYAERCSSGCHRLYAPGLMKPAMWDITVTRMQDIIVRQGLPPITPSQRAVLLDYLTAHSG